MKFMALVPFQRAFRLAYVCIAGGVMTFLRLAVYRSTLARSTCVDLRSYPSMLVWLGVLHD